MTNGYTWVNWTKTSGTTPTTFTAATKSQNIVMACGAVTLQANAADKTAPVSVSITSTSNLKATSQTATLKCTDGV